MLTGRPLTVPHAPSLLLSISLPLSPSLNTCFSLFPFLSPFLCLSVSGVLLYAGGVVCVFTQYEIVDSPFFSSVSCLRFPYPFVCWVLGCVGKLTQWFLLHPIHRAEARTDFWKKNLGGANLLNISEKGFWLLHMTNRNTGSVFQDVFSHMFSSSGGNLHKPYS